MEQLSNTGRVILGMLAMGLRTGYEIKTFVDKSTRFFWAASYGQIYPELKRLEEQGLIHGTPHEGGGRARKEYELTGAGHEALGEWLTSPGEPAYEMRDEMLLKLFFADALPTEEARELLRRRRGHHEAIAANLRTIEPAAARSERGRFPHMAVRYGIGLHEWIAAWCAEMEKELE